MRTPFSCFSTLCIPGMLKHTVQMLIRIYRDVSRNVIFCILYISKHNW